MESAPVTGELGPEMLKFDCKGCGSTHCTWCRKFPKAKNVRQIT